jgi:hypothetical protein
VFRSENDGPFGALVTNTTDTSTLFTGVPGRRYAFYSVARDLVGNEEPAPAMPDATTVVVAAGAPRELTALGPARVWIGLKNSDAAGLRLDVRVKVLIDGTAVAAGEVSNVAAGSSGFNNAILHAIPLALSGGPAAVPAGATLAAEVGVRRTCSGSGHQSGAPRLWFGGQPVDSGTRQGARDAGTRFAATIDGTAAQYFLREHLALSQTAGSARLFVDAAVNSAAACPNRPFTPFGAWSLVLP